MSAVFSSLRDVRLPVTAAIASRLLPACVAVRGAEREVEGDTLSIARPSLCYTPVAAHTTAGPDTDPPVVEGAMLRGRRALRAAVLEALHAPDEASSPLFPQLYASVSARPPIPLAGGPSAGGQTVPTKEATEAELAPSDDAPIAALRRCVAMIHSGLGPGGGAVWDLLRDLLRAGSSPSSSWAAGLLPVLSAAKVALEGTSSGSTTSTATIAAPVLSWELYRLVVAVSLVLEERLRAALRVVRAASLGSAANGPRAKATISILLHEVIRELCGAADAGGDDIPKEGVSSDSDSGSLPPLPGHVLLSLLWAVLAHAGGMHVRNLCLHGYLLPITRAHSNDGGDGGGASSPVAEGLRDCGLIYAHLANVILLCLVELGAWLEAAGLVSGTSNSGEAADSTCAPPCTNLSMSACEAAVSTKGAAAGPLAGRCSFPSLHHLVAPRTRLTENGRLPCDSGLADVSARQMLLLDAVVALTIIEHHLRGPATGPEAAVAVAVDGEKFVSFDRLLVLYIAATPVTTTSLTFPATVMLALQQTAAALYDFSLAEEQPSRRFPNNQEEGALRLGLLLYGLLEAPLGPNLRDTLAHAKEQELLVEGDCVRPMLLVCAVASLMMMGGGEPAHQDTSTETCIACVAEPLADGGSWTAHLSTPAAERALSSMAQAFRRVVPNTTPPMPSSAFSENGDDGEDRLVLHTPPAGASGGRRGGGGGSGGAAPRCSFQSAESALTADVSRPSVDDDVDGSSAVHCTTVREYVSQRPDLDVAAFAAHVRGLALAVDALAHKPHGKYTAVAAGSADAQPLPAPVAMPLGFGLGGPAIPSEQFSLRRTDAQRVSVALADFCQRCEVQLVPALAAMVAEVTVTASSSSSRHAVRDRQWWAIFMTPHYRLTSLSSPSSEGLIEVVFCEWLPRVLALSHRGCAGAQESAPARGGTGNSQTLARTLPKLLQALCDGLLQVLKPPVSQQQGPTGGSGGGGGGPKTLACARSPAYFLWRLVSSMGDIEVALSCCPTPEPECLPGTRLSGQRTPPA